MHGVPTNVARTVLFQKGHLDKGHGIVLHGTSVNNAGSPVRKRHFAKPVSATIISNLRICKPWLLKAGTFVAPASIGLPTAAFLTSVWRPSTSSAFVGAPCAKTKRRPSKWPWVLARAPGRGGERGNCGFWPSLQCLVCWKGRRQGKRTQMRTHC